MMPAVVGIVSTLCWPFLRVLWKHMIIYLTVNKKFIYFLVHCCTTHTNDDDEDNGIWLWCCWYTALYDARITWILSDFSFSLKVVSIIIFLWWIMFSGLLQVDWMAKLIEKSWRLEDDDVIFFCCWFEWIFLLNFYHDGFMILINTISWKN